LAADPRRPVHVLTGFLGSGKTTVLRHLLRDEALAGTAVLINEIGEVGLDHRLIGLVEGEPVLLESGCVCCTIRGDFAAALRRLLGGGIPFDRVVIETTGLADPTPIIATLMADLVLRRALRPGRVLTTIDMVHAAAGLARHAVLRKQAAVADVLLLTKTDLADGRGVADALAALNPLATLVPARFGVVDPSLLDGPTLLDGPAGPRDWLALAAIAAPHDAATAHLSRGEPLDFPAFAVWLSLLAHRHGARLLRVKAVLDVAGSDTPVALHCVQHLIHPPEHLAGWTGPRRSDLVFITDGLDATALRASFDAFVPPGGPAVKEMT
jgi:G3E family GTPase